MRCWQVSRRPLRSSGELCGAVSRIEQSLDEFEGGAIKARPSGGPARCRAVFMSACALCLGVDTPSVIRRRIRGDLIGGVEVRQRERHVLALAIDHHRHGDLREVPTGAPDWASLGAKCSILQLWSGMTLTAPRRLVIVIASAIGQRILRFERSAIPA